jgi:hypothetical protein
LTTPAIEILADVPGRGRVTRDAAGAILGLEQANALWRFDPARNRLDRAAIPLPSGFKTLPTLMWARDAATGALYTADADGRLYRLENNAEFTGPLARVPYAPVGPMAVTCDGRLFGFAGEGMARLFCFEPATAAVTDLGVAVSVFERRRYGYAFADAVVGRDGEIVFGEDDDAGHLWLYFPRIRSAR